MELRDIDIHFDVRTDSYGKDPDSGSPTLKAYHQLLWSKPLPNGQMIFISAVTQSLLVFGMHDTSIVTL